MDKGGGWKDKECGDIFVVNRYCESRRVKYGDYKKKGIGSNSINNELLSLINSKDIENEGQLISEVLERNSIVTVLNLLV